MNLAPQDPAQTRSADRVYDAVKSMAIKYEIKPGARINEGELAKKLNVSRTPLREALNRLVIEGFLTTTLNKGFFARPLDAKRVFDLYEVRCTLEVGIIRLACERATQDELDDLEKTVLWHKDEQEDTAATRLLNLDETFHEELARLTRNGEFLRNLQTINGQIHFVRWIDMQNGRRAHTQSEHLQIVRALQSRDARQAEDLIQQHISRRLDQIVDVIRAGFAEIYMRDNAGQLHGE